MSETFPQDSPEPNPDEQIAPGTEPQDTVDGTEILEPTETEQEAEPQVAVGGIRKAIASRKLDRTHRKLEGLEESGELPPRVVARNERKHAAVGRRGAINMGLAATYGATRDENEKIDSSSITHAGARRKYEKNQHKIDKILAKTVDEETHKEQLHDKKKALEQQLGTVSTQPTETQKPEAQSGATSVKPLSTADRDRLAAKEVVPKTEDAYRKALDLASSKESLDEADIESVMSQIPGASPALGRFTMKRLVMNMVIDQDGKVLKSPDEIQDLLGFTTRNALYDPKKVPNPRELFATAERAVKLVIEQDTSNKTPGKKEQDARAAVWSSMASTVDETQRSAVLELFKQFYRESKAETPAEVVQLKRDPREIYESVKETVDQLVEQDTSRAQKGEKYERASAKAMKLVADMYSAEEVAYLVEQFEQFDREEREKRTSTKRPASGNPR